MRVTCESDLLQIQEELLILVGELRELGAVCDERGGDDGLRRAKAEGEARSWRLRVQITEHSDERSRSEFCSSGDSEVG